MATWYVAPSTVTTTGAGTREQPFRCNAINWTLILPGDNLYLRANLGNYNETLTIGKSGVSGSLINIESDPLDNAPALIDAENTRLTCITQTSKSYIKIKNIKMKRTAGTNNIGILPGSNFVIHGCFFEDMQYAVAAYAIDNIELKDINIFNCSALSVADTTGSIVLNNIDIDTDNNSKSQLIISSPTTGERTLSINNIRLKNAVTPENDQGALRISGLYNTSSKVEHVYIKNSRYKGLYTTTISGITFDKVIVTNSGLSGVFISTGSHDLVFNDCESSWNSDDGFGIFENAYNIKFNRCIANNNGLINPPDIVNNGDGFTAHDASYNIYLNFCVALNNGNTGVAFVDTTAGEINHCTFAFNGNESIGTNRAGVLINTTADNASAPAGSKSWKMSNCVVYQNYPRELGLTSYAKNSVSFNFNSYKPLNDDSFINYGWTASDYTSVSWSQYHNTEGYEPNSRNEDAKLQKNGMLSYNSICIDAAPWILGINDGGETDPWGKKIYGLPNIGADQGSGLPKIFLRLPQIGTAIR